MFWTNNIITDLYKQNPNILYFLIDTFSYALKSPRRDLILNPFPPFIELKNYNKLEEIISKYDYNSFDKFIKSCLIFQYLCFNSYKVICLLLLYNLDNSINNGSIKYLIIY